MSNKPNTSVECSTICWGVAALVGLLSMLLLYTVADYSVFMSILIGVLIGVLLGFALKLFVCGGSEGQSGTTSQRAASHTAADRSSTGATAAASSGGAAASAPAPAASAAEPTPAAPEPAPAAQDPTPASAAPATSAAAATATPSSLMGSGLKASTPLAGEAELASRKGEWKYEAPEAKKAPKKKAPAKKAAAAKPAAETNAAAPAPAAAAANDGPLTEGAPDLFDAAPAGGADDLKLISGVGPKLEQTLNDMGIYMFSQVAVWGAKEIAWVDSRLRFKGRIERDDWMSQAKNLAAGGEPQAPKKKS